MQVPEVSALNFTPTRPLMRAVRSTKDALEQARQLLRQCPLTLIEHVGLSQYLLSRLGDNWHLAVTATAVGEKTRTTHEEGSRSGFHLLDPAHAHVNEK